MTSISPSFAAEQPQQQMTSTQEQQKKEPNELTDAESKQENTFLLRSSENVLENKINTSSIERTPSVTGEIKRAVQVNTTNTYLMMYVEHSRYTPSDYFELYVNEELKHTVPSDSKKNAVLMTMDPVSKGDSITVLMKTGMGKVVGSAKDRADRDYEQETVPSAPEVNEVKDTDTQVTAQAQVKQKK
ncbi:hypothetical protein ACQVQY_30870 [Bacillus mycoides]|uniref:hypothetical protein n=1 Tax=Bacillus mycoides TaxID=1405 RepID=UPI003D6546C6